MQITVNIDSAKTIASLGGYAQKFHDKLLSKMTRLSLELQRHVKEDKLSGQQLHNVTGTLRRSINREVTDDPTGITVTVGTNLSYARVHEFGFKGSVSVKEHLRMQKMAWGKPMKTPRQVTVKAHAMRMNIPERSFLRSALKDMQDRARALIAEAAVEAKK